MTNALRFNQKQNSLPVLQSAFAKCEDNLWRLCENSPKQATFRPQNWRRNCVPLFIVNSDQVAD